jgi:hypothetical protein
MLEDSGFQQQWDQWLEHHGQGFTDHPVRTALAQRVARAFYNRGWVVAEEAAQRDFDDHAQTKRELARVRRELRVTKRALELSELALEQMQGEATDTM